MKKASIFAVFGLASVLLFGAGVVVGRLFPAHHFEAVPQSPYLFDISTGHVCDTQIRKAEAQELQPQANQSNPYDDYFKKAAGPAPIITPCN